jgi:ATP-dependent RNA helicase MSS116
LRQEAAQTQAQDISEAGDREITKFDELIQHNLVHPNVVNAITRGMGHHTMTKVQTMTINQALKGEDM